jgi:hypothetical protein
MKVKKPIKELFATFETKIESQETVTLKMTEELAHQKKLVRMLAEGWAKFYEGRTIEETLAWAEEKVAEQEKEERHIAWAEEKVKEQEGKT